MRARLKAVMTTDPHTSADGSRSENKNTTTKNLILYGSCQEKYSDEIPRKQRCGRGIFVVFTSNFFVNFREIG